MLEEDQISVARIAWLELAITETITNITTTTTTTTTKHVYIQLTALGATSSPSGVSLDIILHVTFNNSCRLCINSSLPLPCVALNIIHKAQ